MGSGKGHLATVKFLLENGADIDAKDDRGYTARDHAKVSKMIKLLEECGAR
jgi:ankyrin repeat protein